jgi:hypothetical protein
MTAAGCDATRPGRTNDLRPPARPDPLAFQVQGDGRAVDLEELGKVGHCGTVKVPVDQLRYLLVR